MLLKLPNNINVLRREQIGHLQLSEQFAVNAATP